jgi:hypothetical protein
VPWSAWGWDRTATATQESVFRLVARGLHGGGTVPPHDSDRGSKPESRRSTLGALPLLPALLGVVGRRVGTLREHGLEKAPARVTA